MASRRASTSTENVLAVIAKAARSPKRRASRSENVRRTAKKKGALRLRKNAHLDLDHPEVKRQTDKTLADIEAAVGDLDALEKSTGLDILPKHKSRYGLTKSKIFHGADKRLSALERRWQRIVDRYDEQLEDLLNAREAEIVSQAEFLRLREPIVAKRRKAAAELERAELLANRRRRPPRLPAKAQKRRR